MQYRETDANSVDSHRGASDTSEGLDGRTATAADGPLTAEWLRESFDLRALSSHERRTVQRWATGRQATIRGLETILGSLGVGVWAVPHHLWRPYDNGRRGWRSTRC